MIIRNLIKMSFRSGGDLLMTDGGIPVEFMGDVYEPDLYLATDGIGDVEETLEITTGDFQVTLNIASEYDPVLLAFYDDDYLNQTITYYRQYIWDDGSEEFDKLFEGRMIEYEATDAEDGYTIEVTSSANIIHWQQVRGRSTNSDSQHQFYPDDRGLDYAGTEISDIKWGK
ncbi:hypothetical protein MSP8886_01447 [Marinomonas spartinae]|uniref:Uncharacterized protein n=1 Tax=Marinomonas spartinae TaxID=1792290 RepID=A0A1A8T8V7_9GAMM|nr:hypothetical protein [Marinomonas spartinae]SBS29122.1 hypothetical protein MSP8886_01447 [Marinomonas spartinae]